MSGNGAHVSWTLGPCANAQSYPHEIGYTEYGKQYTERCCLPPGDYMLTCKVSSGEGWNGGFMEIQGNRYCHDFLASDEASPQVTIRGRHVHIKSLF